MTDLKQWLKHPETKVLQEKLASQAAEIERLTPLQFRGAPCHTHCEATAFTIEARAMTAEIGRLKAEVDRLRVDIERLNRIAWLIGSIYVHGNFKAETFNERELEKRLRENGTFWDTLQEFDAARAALENKHD